MPRVTVGSLELFYESRGEGPPLLLIMGLDRGALGSATPGVKADGRAPAAPRRGP